MQDYWNYRVHPPSVLSRLFPGKQKSGTTFLQGREDDVTMPRQSTFTMWSRQLFKVKAKLSSQLFRFPPTRLLLGLYDYRFKHIAVMEEEYHDIITTLQVIRLLQLFGQQELESRTTPFKGREDDMTTPASTTSTSSAITLMTSPTLSLAPNRLITRSRAKKIQQEVHALLFEFQLNSNDNFKLPKSCMLILLRYVEENHQDEGHEARIGKVLVIQQGHSAISSNQQVIRQSIRQSPESEVRALNCTNLRSFT
jgi:hypothetical protein